MISHVSINSLAGGMALGFEAVNPAIVTKMFYETNKPCRYLLGEYWPDAVIFHQHDEFVREIRKHGKKERIDVISGRYRKPKDWTLIRNAIDAARPRAVVIEGMATLRSRGLVEILQDFWSLGYDAEGHVVPACSLGTVYKGERFWIVAHAHGDGRAEGGEPSSEQGDVGKQFVTDDLLDEYRTQLEGRGETARGSVFSEPRVLRRDDGFSRRVDSTRVRVLSDDVSPTVAGFIGWCLSRVLNDSYESIPMDKLASLERIHNAEKKTAYVVNVAALDNAKIEYEKKNGGVHLIVRTPKGSTIDYWPSTDVYIVRGTDQRGFGVKNVISGYATI